MASSAGSPSSSATPAPAAHRAQPQRPGGHRRAPAPAPRGRTPARGARRLQARAARRGPADHLETVLPAYTHLQRAQVTSLAQHLLAYFWMLDRDRDGSGPREACLELPLGAGAAVGLDFELDRAAEAADLGFERVARKLTRRRRRPRLRRRLSRRRGAAGPHLAARRRARAVDDRRVRLRAPAGRLQRRLEHHAAEEEPRRRRAHAGGRLRG